MNAWTDTVNVFVTGASWFHSDELQDMDGTATVIPRRENLNIANVTQLDKDAILVCYDNVVKVVTPQGRLKVSKKQLSELRFDFKIDSIRKCILPSSLGWLCGDSMKLGFSVSTW